MKGEIIAIGDELTSGRILNTTSGFAARHLYDAGYEIYAMHTIGDTPSLIGEALKRAIGRVDFVVVTGGLGTTDDDLTNEAVSAALNRPTMPNLEVLSLVRQHLIENSEDPLSPLEKLAWLPKGAEVLNPQSRMAGYQLVHDDKPVFFLPGIPNQMQQLLLEQVIPRLATWYSDPKRKGCQTVLRIFDMDEIEVNKRISELKLDTSINIGYYPIFPELHLCLTIRDNNIKKPDFILQDAIASVYKSFGDVIYGENQNNMETVIGKLLHKNNLKLAVAESCTGGLISHKVTKVPGSSRYFLGGIISYANSMKSDYLEIDYKLLQNHGAVSKEVAGAMAMSILAGTGADLALSVTGIAGPDGGTEEKPVGTVYIGLVSSQFFHVNRFQFEGSREQIQEISAVTGLNMIRKHLLKL